MKSNLELLHDDIKAMSKMTFEDNIKARLDKTLELYRDELDKASARLLCKKTTYIMKELNKK